MEAQTQPTGLSLAGPSLDVTAGYPGARRVASCLMETPLNASATSAGALFSSTTFLVPPYQREYAWSDDEVSDFWDDLRGGLGEGSYFLGLVILTEEETRKHVVDGQQRILTLTLLAAAMNHEALRIGRRALADRLKSDFLMAIDYDTDEVNPRVVLSDTRDDATLQALVATGSATPDTAADQRDGISDKLADSYSFLLEALRKDLTADPFKRLGMWAEYLTKRVYLAVFVHPDPSAAYRVFEAINTRGRDLTTADLLKNYVISQTAARQQDARYRDWQTISRPLSQAGTGALVQYIRHVITVHAGHVLPRELFTYIAERGRSTGDRDSSRERRRRPRPPSVDELMGTLSDNLPLYMQMVDPTLDGPAEPEWLGVFSALNDLNVISVRPLLLAVSATSEAADGMKAVLRLVVRRIVVGNLGTGNVERRLGDAARQVRDEGAWQAALDGFRDLNPDRLEFVRRLCERSYNKGTLTFLRRAQVQRTVTPDSDGILHMIRPRQATDWTGFRTDDFAFWGSTVGNTLLTSTDRRPKGAGTWDGFKQNLLPLAVDGEDVEALSEYAEWTTSEVTARGLTIAERSAEIWF